MTSFFLTSAIILWYHIGSFIEIFRAGCDPRPAVKVRERKLNRCNSDTDCIVRMEEDVFLPYFYALGISIPRAIFIEEKVL